MGGPVWKFCQELGFEHVVLGMSMTDPLGIGSRVPRRRPVWNRPSGATGAPLVCQSSGMCEVAGEAEKRPLKSPKTNSALSKENTQLLEYLWNKGFGRISSEELGPVNHLWLPDWCSAPVLGWPTRCKVGLETLSPPVFPHPTSSCSPSFLPPHLCPDRQWDFGLRVLEGF